MEEENDALIKAVKRALKEAPLYVLHMEEENDALILDVRRALEGILLYV